MVVRVQGAMAVEISGTGQPAGLSGLSCVVQAHSVRDIASGTACLLVVGLANLQTTYRCW